MNAFLLDFRQSLRGLWKVPGFMVPAALSLALGIGANTATFSALRAALTPQLAWENPQELVFVGRQDSRFPNLPPTLDVNYATFQLWQARQAVLSPLAGFTRTNVTLGGPIEPRSAAGMRVSPEFWPVLGVKPLMGRLPDGAEEGVMVASHKLWVSALGKDPSAVGKAFQVAGRSRILVGILPPGAVWMGTEVFVPLEPSGEEKAAHSSFLSLVGRMRPGLNEANVQAAFRTMNTQLQASDAAMRPISAVPRRLMEIFYGNDMIRGRQRLLAWTSLFVTILACVNLSTLVLGRSASRLHELGIRQAVGASRTQLFTPLFCDLLVAALPGLLLGWAFSAASGTLLDAFIPRDLRAFHAPSLLDFAVAAGAALLLALTGAVLPALLLPRIRTFGLLGGTRSSGTPGVQWTQKGLVVVQVGLALTLLSSFGLVYRSLQSLEAAPIGIAADTRLLATLSLPARSPEDQARRELEVAQALERIQALPGVAAAGTTNLLPVVSQGGYNGNMRIPGRTEPAFVSYRTATPGYFEAAGIPLLEGRAFRASDDANNPQVLIVSQSLAKDYFPGQNVVGLSLPLDNSSLVIVGVVSDAKMDNDFRQPGKNQTLYFPGATNISRVDLVVKVNGNPRALLQDLRRVLRAQWPDTSLDRVRLLSEALSQGNESETTQVMLMGLLAILALVLTVAGIYGVLSRQVERRRREMGIRLALGGVGREIVSLVVSQAMRVVGIGLIVGVGGSLGMGRVLRNQLFQVSPSDPYSIVPALLLLAVASLLTCLIPALRAASVDPIVALREE